MADYRSIPGPSPSRGGDSVANVLHFSSDPLEYMSRARRKYGDVTALVRGGNDSLYVHNPDCPGTIFAFGPRQNEKILREADTFHSASLIASLLPRGSEALRRITTGLFSYNGAEHRRQRQLVWPPFHRKSVEAFCRVTGEVVENFIGGWKPETVVDVELEMKRLVLQVVWKTFFGVDSFSVPELAALTEEWLKRLLNLGKTWSPNLPGSPLHRICEEAEIIEQEIRKIIQAPDSGGPPRSVLSLLKASRDEQGEGLSEEELVGHGFSMLMAGYETTANAVTWSLFLLVNHPAVLSDLHEELQGHLGGEAPPAERMGRLSLLDLTVKESLRILPPASLGWRIAARETGLGEYEIPAGTEVIYSPFHTHHSPELYREPECFRPGRWEHLRPSPYEYLPFSAGPRMCLGASFATQTIKVILSLLVQRFRFEIPPGTRVDYELGITLFPKQGLPLRLREQDSRFAEGKREVTGTIRKLVKLC